jgi:hypothetical protein
VLADAERQVLRIDKGLQLNRARLRQQIDMPARRSQ